MDPYVKCHICPLQAICEEAEVDSSHNYHEHYEPKKDLLDDEELKAMAEEVSKLTDATRYCPLLLSIPKTEETRNTTEQHD